MNGRLFRVAEIEDTRRDNFEYAIGPVMKYMTDPLGQNVCFNGGDPGPVFFQIAGRGFERVPETLTRADRRIILGYLANSTEPARAFDETRSGLSISLPFGLAGRVQAQAAPISDYIATIRLRAKEVWSIEQWAERGEMVIAPRERIVDRSQEATPLDAMRAAVRRGDRIFIVGENGAGKTTFLDSVCLEIKKQFPHDRIAFVQDVDESQGLFENQITLEVGHEQIHFEINGVITRGEFSWKDALKALLRHAVKRIIWSELREEASALGLLKASFAGLLDGFATTLHANSASHTFKRLEQLLPGVTRDVIGDLVDFILVCEQYVDEFGVTRRRVCDMVRCFGFDSESEKYDTISAVAA
jgi:type IV secretory pathway ATPase VirB11/archaellum biosynthesis ATPase